ncbi:MULTISPECIES: hypothetical protein [unclassified Rhodococcus (in: high G+C Gram-positive bacteria)]|uniref:hypothetical protein n=1 Tax=unclassified Rhodococcus (in: high G+C Gram-positive bacteria) TaxID=192944 RepID=UPI00339321BA
MSSNDLFGGPKRLLIVVTVVVAVTVLAAIVTLIVRQILGPPEGPSPYDTPESMSYVLQITSPSPL